MYIVSMYDKYAFYKIYMHYKFIWNVICTRKMYISRCSIYRRFRRAIALGNSYLKKEFFCNKCFCSEKRVKVYVIRMSCQWPIPRKVAFSNIFLLKFNVPETRQKKAHKKACHTCQNFVELSLNECFTFFIFNLKFMKKGLTSSII